MQPCQDASKHVGTSHDLFSTLKDETHRTSYLGPGHHILHISWRNGRWTSRSCSDSCPIPTLCNPIYERRTDYNHLSVPIRLIDQPGGPLSGCGHCAGLGDPIRMPSPDVYLL